MEEAAMAREDSGPAAVAAVVGTWGSDPDTPVAKGTELLMLRATAREAAGEEAGEALVMAEEAMVVTQKSIY